MRARIVELDGTPAEVAQVLSQIEEKGGTKVTDGPTKTGASAVPPHVVEWLDHWKVRGPRRHHFERLVEEVLSWPEVDVKILKGRGEEDSSRRIRFVRSDQREAFGILGYRGALYPALDADFDTSPYRHAERRQAKNLRRPIRAYVRTADAVDEALDLLHKAYERQAAK